MHLWLKDGGGNEAMVSSDSILVDTTPPTCVLDILDGSAAHNYTTRSLVNLSLTADSATQYMIFNDTPDPSAGDIAANSWTTWPTTGGANPQPQALAPAWWLNAGPNYHTATLICRDQADNRGPASTDGIYVDLYGPNRQTLKPPIVDPVLIENVTNVLTPTISWSATTDDLSGLHAAQPYQIEWARDSVYYFGHEGTKDKILTSTNFGTLSPSNKSMGSICSNNDRRIQEVSGGQYINDVGTERNDFYYWVSDCIGTEGRVVREKSDGTLELVGDQSIFSGTGGSSFKNFTALSEDDIWVLTGSSIYHYDGGSWKNLAKNGSYGEVTQEYASRCVPGICSAFYDLHAVDANNVWVSGSYGFIWHYDGSYWYLVRLDPTCTNSNACVVMRVAAIDEKTAFYIVNDNTGSAGRKIGRLTINGVTASGSVDPTYTINYTDEVFESGLAWRPFSLWANSPDDAMVAGYSGYSMHWDGTSWSALSQMPNSSNKKSLVYGRVVRRVVCCSRQSR